MTVLRSILLFVLAALAEIGGAWLVWQGIREHRGLAFVGAGILALGLYGFVATFQPDPHFGRILAAYLDQQYPGQRWLPIDSRALQTFLATAPTVAKDALGRRGFRRLWRLGRAYQVAA